MRLDYWMIYLLIPLVIGILALIAVAPDEIPQPKIHENIIKDAESIETESQAFTVEMEETISMVTESPIVPLGCCGWWLYVLSFLPSIFGVGVSAVLIEYSQPLAYVGLAIIFGFNAITALKLHKEKRLKSIESLK